MKSKNFTKKLTLNKKTIADLSNEQLNQVKGGCASKPGETSCHTWWKWCTQIYVTCEDPNIP